MWSVAKQDGTIRLNQAGLKANHMGSSSKALSVVDPGMSCPHRQTKADAIVLEVAMVYQQRCRLQQRSEEHPCALLGERCRAIEDAHARYHCREQDWSSANKVPPLVVIFPRHTS